MPGAVEMVTASWQVRAGPALHPVAITLDEDPEIPVGVDHHPRNHNLSHTTAPSACSANEFTRCQRVAYQRDDELGALKRQVLGVSVHLLGFQVVG